MKFGTLYSYWSKNWDCDYENYAKLIEKLSTLGFDILEVSADHVYRMARQDLKKLNELGKQHNMIFTTNSGPAKEFDLASTDAAVRKNGIQYFNDVMERMIDLGSTSLAGAIYSYWPCDFSDTDKEGAWTRSIESMKAVGKIAEKLGITISLEVLNRNESFILNTCEEALAYCKRVGSPAVKILLDTYHMNIEEDDSLAAIRAAGPLLGHLHVGENNRKLPGMNNSIDWKALGGALRDIDYHGNVVMEPFLVTGGSVGNSIRVWRDLSSGANESTMDRYISESLRFLKATFA
jgi:D-psicose/D-tagatose/L-ribulose 3-epimerase